MNQRSAADVVTPAATEGGSAEGNGIGGLLSSLMRALKANNKDDWPGKPTEQWALDLPSLAAESATQQHTAAAGEASADGMDGVTEATERNGEDCCVHRASEDEDAHTDSPRGVYTVTTMPTKQAGPNPAKGSEAESLDGLMNEYLHNLRRVRALEETTTDAKCEGGGDAKKPTLVSEKEQQNYEEMDLGTLLQRLDAFPIL